MSNYIRTIAIVGAGGTIGQFITSALLKQGKHTLTALTRPNSTNSPPTGLHSIKHVSYDSHADLKSALTGQDALIITMGSTAPKDTQTRLVDAAIDAGVHYILLNEYGTDHSHASLARETLLGETSLQLRAHVEARAREKHQPTKWLALTCSFWYEFSLAGSEASFGFDLDKKSLTLFDDGETPICTSTLPLCGSAVAKLFALPIQADSEGEACLDMFANSPVMVSSFTVSQRDMLASVLRVTGDKESDWTITHEDAKERYPRAIGMLQKGNRLGFIMALYTRVFFRNGGGDFSHKTVNKVLGLDEEDLDESTNTALKYHADGTIRRNYAIKE